MNITAKQIQRSNIMLVYPEGATKLPEAAQIFSLYPGKDSQGSIFSDAPSLATRIFEFPVPGLQLIFEPGRFRLEDKLSRTPAESKLAHELHRITASLYPDARPTAYGYNYDMIYRMDTVVPVKEIMASFLKPSTLEDVQSFGWQYTLSKEKGKRAETYFFKNVSPIEYSVHANFHFNDPVLPKSDDLQADFERRYADADESVSQIKM